jgi:hypothetical protein
VSRPAGSYCAVVVATTCVPARSAARVMLVRSPARLEVKSIRLGVTRRVVPGCYWVICVTATICPRVSSRTCVRSPPG